MALTTNKWGRLTVRLPAVNDAKLIGQVFSTQWLIVDLQANQLGFVVSNAATFKIGA